MTFAFIHLLTQIKSAFKGETRTSADVDKRGWKALQTNVWTYRCLLFRKTYKHRTVYLKETSTMNLVITKKCHIVSMLPIRPTKPIHEI